MLIGEYMDDLCLSWLTLLSQLKTINILRTIQHYSKLLLEQDMHAKKKKNTVQQTNLESKIKMMMCLCEAKQYISWSRNENTIMSTKKNDI